MTAMKYVPLQVIKGAEILEVLHSLPSVRQYLFSLYECRYSVFFQSLGEQASFSHLKKLSKLILQFIATNSKVLFSLLFKNILMFYLSE